MKTKRRGSRGQSLVEVALVLPVLVMLMLGLLDFGRAYYAVVALRDAADEGAAYAAINPTDVLGIRRRASEASPQLVPIAPNDVHVVYPPVLYAGAPITVTTSYTMELYTPFANMLVDGSQLQLRGQASHPILSTD